MIKGEEKSPGTIIYFCPKHRRNQSERPAQETQAPRLRMRHKESNEIHIRGQTTQKTQEENKTRTKQKTRAKKGPQNQEKSTAKREPMYKKKARQLAASVQTTKDNIPQQLYQITRDAMDYRIEEESSQHSNIQEIRNMSKTSYV